MGQTIVCGLGQVGYRVAMLLIQMGEKVTVVAVNSVSEFEREIRELGVDIVAGDARDSAVLESAGVRTAKAIISVTDSDLTNIEISLDAQVLNPNIRVVARLFDQTLAKRLERSVGIHRALAMSVLAAPSFAAAAIGSDLFGSFEFNGATYSVHHSAGAEANICRAEKMTLPRAKRRKQRMTFAGFLHEIPSSLKWLFTGISALTILSVLVFCSSMHLSLVESIYFVVTTLTTTGYGDITVKGASNSVMLYTCLMMILGSAAVATLYSIITDYFVSSRFDEILGRQKISDRDHIVVVGLGNVGFRVCEALSKLGYSVVAIDSNPSAKYRSLLPPGITFIAGDGRDEETLQLAGIETAMSIISSTNDDAVNLSTCLIAKGVGPQVKTVVRLFDGGFARKVERALDIDTALSASRISAPGFVGAAIFEESVFSYTTATEFVTIVPEQDEFRFIRRPLKPL